jgi:hypothetical protein
LPPPFVGRRDSIGNGPGSAAVPANDPSLAKQLKPEARRGAIIQKHEAATEATINGLARRQRAAAFPQGGDFDGASDR